MRRAGLEARLVIVHHDGVSRGTASCCRSLGVRVGALWGPLSASLGFVNAS